MTDDDFPVPPHTAPVVHPPCACTCPWDRHAEVGLGDERCHCLDPHCACLRYRPGPGVTR